MNTGLIQFELHINRRYLMQTLLHKNNNIYNNTTLDVLKGKIKKKGDLYFSYWLCARQPA